MQRERTTDQREPEAPIEGSAPSRREVWIPLGLLTLSLGLPVANGEEIFGLMRGWMFLILPPLMLVYVLLPCAYLIGRRRPTAALVLSILSVLVWVLTLVSAGPMFSYGHEGGSIIASGTFVALAGSLAATLVWLRVVRCPAKARPSRARTRELLSGLAIAGVLFVGAFGAKMLLQAKHSRDARERLAQEEILEWNRFLGGEQIYFTVPKTFGSADEWLRSLLGPEWQRAEFHGFLPFSRLETWWVSPAPSGGMRTIRIEYPGGSGLSYAGFSAKSYFDLWLGKLMHSVSHSNWHGVFGLLSPEYSARLENPVKLRSIFAQLAPNHGPMGYPKTVVDGDRATSVAPIRLRDRSFVVVRSDWKRHGIRWEITHIGPVER